MLSSTGTILLQAGHHSISNMQIFQSGLLFHLICVFCTISGQEHAIEGFSWDPTGITEPQTAIYESTRFPSTENPCVNDDNARSYTFNAFLSHRMRDWVDWIHDNGLDPTPPTGSFNIHADSSFLQLDADYWNTMISRITQSYSYVYSDLFGSQFRIETSLSDLKIQGLHESVGSILSTYPLDGTGEWSFDSVSISASFEISGFGVVNGHVNIDDYDYRNFKVQIYGSSLRRLPGFLEPEDANGLGRTVLEELGPRIRSALENGQNFPLEPVLLNYLKSVFEETSLEEILNTTPGPCFP